MSKIRDVLTIVAFVELMGRLFSCCSSDDQDQESDDESVESGSDVEESGSETDSNSGSDYDDGDFDF